MTPTSKRPTVEMFYELYTQQTYEPNGYYCVDSEFVPSYDTKIKTFEDDKLYIQPEKEFILTTLKQIGAT